jgi:hypothetical protein
MFELLFVFGILALGVLALIGFLKLLVALVLLPFKIAWWTAKGLVGLLLVVPLIVISVLVVTNVFPLVLFMLLLPVIIVTAAVAFLVKLVFC